MQQLIIHEKLPSWNVIIGKSNWRNYKKIKDEWHKLTFVAVKEYKIKPVKEYPVSLYFTCNWRTRQPRDIDSVYIKGIVDGLVECKILEDDNTNFVKIVILEGNIGTGKDEIIIKII